MSDKKPQKYILTLQDGTQIPVLADEMHEPEEYQGHYVFKLDGETVGKYMKADVKGWHIEYPKSSSGRVIR